MNLAATGVGVLGFGAMFLELFLRVMAIYTMFIVIKALNVYINKNS